VVHQQQQQQLSDLLIPLLIFQQLTCISAVAAAIILHKYLQLLDLFKQMAEDHTVVVDELPVVLQQGTVQAEPCE
jgi:hypothetical protein